MCIDCLCDYFSLTRESAENMIERFRKSGCTLFASLPAQPPSEPNAEKNA